MFRITGLSFVRQGICLLLCLVFSLNASATIQLWECKDTVGFYTVHLDIHADLEKSPIRCNAEGRSCVYDIFMHSGTAEGTARLFCESYRYPLDGGGFGYLVFQHYFLSNAVFGGAACDRPDETPSSVECTLRRKNCPSAQGDGALNFDAITPAGCGCSDDAYEARNEPDASPPQVGCFLIEPPEEEEPEDEADKDDGDPCEEGEGNPCNVATGNKYQSETDISGSLSFVRSYNSRNLIDIGLGKGWRNSYQKRLSIAGNKLNLVSSAGRGEPWTKTGGTWSGDADSDFILTENASGFTVTRQNGDVEQYDTSGNLVSETDTKGKTTVYAYDGNNQLITVTNHFGQSLSFTYDANGHLETATDASGAVYTYEYDANDNLVAVIYPDTTPIDNSDNLRRTYHYEKVDYPNHLTGITDENGDRYATYAYDAEGKAISTEHAPTTNTVGQERFELDYQE